MRTSWFPKEQSHKSPLKPPDGYQQSSPSFVLQPEIGENLQDAIKIRVSVVESEVSTTFMAFPASHVYFCLRINVLHGVVLIGSH